jgi:hypothetical protein
MPTKLYRRNAIASFGAGIAALCITGWLFLSQAFFYWNSMPLQGRVVEVSYEKVSSGRGSVMAYVPIVELNEFGQGMRIKVDTSNASAIYSIGSLMNLRCTSESMPVCRENRFFSLWSSSIIAFFITLVFLGLGLFFGWKVRRAHFITPRLST